jgi:esterase/lipase
MLNKDEDEMFDPAAAHVLFDSVSADSKQLRFSQGRHDDWGPDLIAESVGFVNTHVLPATGAPPG